MSMALNQHVAPRLWVHVIGPMQATDAAGRSVLPRTRKARAMLAVLALAAPKPVSRTRIAGLLWSRRDREQARGSLRQCLHELQGLLHPLGPGLIEADREQVRLGEHALWLDINAAERPAGGLLEDLVGLDPAFDAWIEVEQARLLSPALPAPTAAGVRLGVQQLRILGAGGRTPVIEGLSDEIIAALSRFRWIACLVSSAPDEDAAEVGLDYLLSGTARLAGEQIRIGLRLQDMRAGGEVVWARSFDVAEADDALETQDAIAAQTAAQIEPELLLREGGRAGARLGALPAAYDLTMSAIPGILRLEREGFERSGRMLKEAVSLEPQSEVAHVWCAYWHLLAVGQGWIAEPEAAMARAGELAERAVALDPSDALALTIAGHVRGFLNKQIEEAMVLHERAIALNPALPLAWVMSGLAQNYRGEHRDAIRRMERARLLSPFDPHAFLFNAGLMGPHIMLGEYEQAATLGRLTAQLNPSFSSSWKALLVALAHLDRAEEVAAVRARLLALEPGFSVRAGVERSPFRRSEDLARWAEGLRLGGLPE